MRGSSLFWAGLAMVLFAMNGPGCGRSRGQGTTPQAGTDEEPPPPVSRPEGAGQKEEAAPPPAAKKAPTQPPPAPRVTVGPMPRPGVVAKAVLKGLRVPRITVQKVYLKKLSLRRVTVRAVCKVVNPLAVVMPALTFHYTLWINGIRMNQGQAVMRSAVGPRSSTEAVVDLSVGPRAAIRVAGRLMRGRGTYRISGRFLGKVGPLNINIPVEKQGVFIKPSAYSRALGGG